MMSGLLHFQSQPFYHEVISSPHFQDLNPYDCFIWRFLKNSVYSNTPYVVGGHSSAYEPHAVNHSCWCGLFNCLLKNGD